jgi:predicted Zn-dependent protease
MGVEYISRNGIYGAQLLFLLLLTVLSFPINLAASDFNSPKTFDHPWDHSPITVYIDSRDLPPHYKPTYYTQIERALNYWEEGGNGKLSYTPVFKIIDSENADIRIRWVDNVEKDTNAPPGVAGYTTPQIKNERFVHVDIILGVGDYKGTKWVQYDDETMLVLAEHELGHALGLEHSNDKGNIMYPDYKQKNNTGSLLTGKNGFLLIIGYGVLAVIVFLAVNRLFNRKQK